MDCPQFAEEKTGSEIQYFKEVSEPINSQESLDSKMYADAAPKPLPLWWSFPQICSCSNSQIQGLLLGPHPGLRAFAV